jgi:TRAP-type C4-dicarboxylate transport system substrate-binding protein
MRTGTKWRKTVVGLGVSLALASVSACSNADGGGNSEETKVSLRVADSLPPGHVVSDEGIKYWMERVEEETNGQVEFEYFPTEQLVPSDAMLSSIQDGTVDIAYVYPQYYSSKLPLSDVSGLPGYYSSAEEGSRAWWQLLNEALAEQEYLPLGVKPVFGVTFPPYQMVSRGEAVRTVEDWRGMTVRSAGGVQDATVTAMGATPVSVSGPEIYTAMQRGTVDATLLPLSSIESYNLQEVSAAATTNALLGGGGFTYSINADVWQSLPEAVQEAMRTAGEETVTHLSSSMDEREVEAQEKLTDMQFVTLDNAQQEAWDEATDIVSERWEEERQARGLPAAEMLQTWREIVGSNG